MKTVHFALTTASESLNQEPKSYQQEMICDDKEKWQKAMEDEIESLYKNKTQVLVKRLKDKKLVDCKWIYKKKEAIPGVKKARYKAKLVARGFTQKQGVDYT